MEPLPAVSRERPGPRRRLRLLLVLVPALYVVLVLLMNVALWSGLVEHVISGKRERSTVHLELEHGWLLWPNRVHVRGLELDIDAYNYRLRVVVPRARADIALWELFDQAFHARRIRAEDATIILQLKPETPAADPERLAELPHLGDGPPVKSPERPDPPEFRRAFRVELEDIDATLEQFWFGELRLYGPHGRLRGGVFSITGHRFGVPETTLTVEGGTLGTASVPAALRDVHGTLRLAIAEYDLAELRGRDVLPQIDAGANLTAEVETLAFVRPFLPDAGPGGLSYELAGGRGTWSVDASLERGMLTPDSRVALDVRDVVGRIGPARLYGHLGVHAEVERRAEAGVAVTGHVELGGLRGFSGDANTPWVVAEPIAGNVTFAVTEPAVWTLGRYDVAAPNLEVRDLAVLPIPGATLEGRAVVQLHAERRARRHRLRGELELHDVEVAVAEVRGGASGRIAFAGSVDPATHRTTVDALSGSLRDIDIRSPEGRNRDAWLQVSDARIDVVPARGTVTARMQGRLSDLPALLVHTSVRPALIALADFGISDPVAFDVEVRRDRRALAVKLHDVTGPRLDVRGHFVRRGDQTRYAAWLAGPRIGVRGTSAGDGPRFRLKARADRSWLETQHAWVEAKPEDENGS